MRPAIFLFLLMSAGLGFSQEEVVNFRVTQDRLESDYPSLAGTGKWAGLAWMDGRDGNEEIYFRLVDASSRRLGPEVRLTDSANWDYQPQLVWNGNGFGLAWVHERRARRDLCFLRLSETGAKLSGPERILDQGLVEKSVRLAWIGQGYGLVWTDYRPGNGEIFFRLLSSLGQPLGEEVRVTEGPGLSEPGTLVWTGLGFWLAYLDYREGTGQVYVTRMSAQGTRLGSEEKLSRGGECTLPTLAWSRDQGAVVWTEKQGAVHQLMAHLVSGASGAEAEPLMLTSDPSDKIQATIAAGGSGFGVAFWARTGSSRTLKFLFLPADGLQPTAGQRNLTPARRAEAGLDASWVCPGLSMIFDGFAFVIAWVDLKEEMNTEIYLTRVPQEQ